MVKMSRDTYYKILFFSFLKRVHYTVTTVTYFQLATLCYALHEGELVMQLPHCYTLRLLPYRQA